MEKYSELPYTKLRRIYDPNHFHFRSTKDLREGDEIIGQDRGAKAMEFGLQVKNQNYNIFIVGTKGTGKTNYAKRNVKGKAKLENIPDDWCYVHNFDNPNHPIALNMPPGMGKILSEDMKELIDDLLKEIPKIFSGDVYERRKSEIIKAYQDERNDIVEQLTQYSEERGFSIKHTSSGFVFAPYIDGETISDKEYEALDEEQKKHIEKKAEDLQMKAAEILRKIKSNERRTKTKIAELDHNMGLDEVKPLMDELFDKYKNHDNILNYLEKIFEDVVDNIYDFDVSEEEYEGNEKKKFEEALANKYGVNLFIDNSNSDGAPVVMECNPNYNNLIGRVDYENEQGTLKTNFMMIKAGAVHKANGGYLILQATEVLTNLQSWDTLKRILKTGEVSIESLRSQLGIVDITSLKPQPIPINLKVILIGSPYLYQMMYTYDEDFQKLFKIKVDFDSEMDANIENERKIIHFISSYCNEQGLRHVDPSGVAQILEYGHRIAGSQKKMTTRFNKMVEILIEADVWAELDKSLVIEGRHVKKAHREKIYRANKIEQKIEEMYINGKIILDVVGKKIGRINGLSVMDVGDYVFGKPSVITVTTYTGNKGIVNIEREVQMSGSIHDKGIMILEGYLSELFAQEYPMTLTAKICFEQSYGGVDGDSASSTELYGILSSLADIPVKQYIAVTGSVNQKGEIQPVGGVSEKIEGFFALCSILGLSGEQGVIIPYQNVEDLVLGDEVVNAVKKGIFHIYPISTIKQGVEILTDMSFVEVCEAVENKLNKYRDAVKKNMEEKNNDKK